MSNANIPDEHHLMRFVPYKQQQRHPETDIFLGILNTAFRVRASDDGNLSLTWVEHYGEKNVATYRTAASKFRESFTQGRLPGKAVFAIGQAGLTRQVALDHDKKIRIVHAPDGPNTGHAELRRFSDDDLELLDALAIEVYSEHVAVADLQLP